MWFTGFVIKDDALLSVSNGWTKGVTLVIALLWLTTVFLQNCNSQKITLKSFEFILTFETAPKIKNKSAL